MATGNIFGIIHILHECNIFFPPQYPLVIFQMCFYIHGTLRDILTIMERKFTVQTEGTEENPVKISWDSLLTVLLRIFWWNYRFKRVVGRKVDQLHCSRPHYSTLASNICCLMILSQYKSLSRDCLYSCCSW